MGVLDKLFNGIKTEMAPTIEQKDRIAELLNTSPEALAAFEQAYRRQIDNAIPDDFFKVNSRQASRQNKVIDSQPTEMDMATGEALISRIVDELIAQTKIYSYNGNQGKFGQFEALPEQTGLVSNEDLQLVPEALRPQLTGSLMKVDIPEMSYPALMEYYIRATDPKEKPEMRRHCYNRFRQGLDILDLDGVTYEIIGTNPNSMGKWFPPLVEACIGQDFFKLPRTVIAKVPMSLLQLTRQEYSSLTPMTIDIVDKWAFRVFGLDENKEYFIKTGTYSSKYDFRNARVRGAKEVRELGEYLLFIHFQALMMASPLSKPCIYGVSTTNEWVVREYIPPVKDNCPTIYKGMPLRPEYRVFVDCDTDKVIGISPYWEPNTMKKRFAGQEDANDPDMVHDYIVYKACEIELMSEYKKNHNLVATKLQELLPKLNLKGQWSVDVMQNGDDFYIIDMALAENSAFYECVPKPLRNPLPEDWMPKLGG